MTPFLRHHGLLACVVLALPPLLLSCAPGPGDEVIATFEGGMVTKTEFESYLQSMDKRRLRTDASVSTEEGMREILLDYAVNRILAAEGAMPEAPTTPILYLTPEARSLVQYYRQRTGKRNREVSEEQALAAYNEHLDSRYTLPERVRFQHIFLRSDLRSGSELRSLERQIVEEYRGGVPLETLVVRYSESASKTKDGMVGPVYRGRLDESFENQLFALSEGEDLAVVRTDLGTHLVRIVELKESRVLPFDEVKRQVVSGLVERQNETERNAFFATLRDHFGVVDRSDEGGLAADDAVLTIGERSINQDQLDEFLRRSALFGAAHQGTNRRQRRTMVDNMVQFNLMYLDALEQGLDQEANFQQRWLLTEMSTKASGALNARVGQWAESVDDEVVLEFYREHEARFTEPQRIDISYIFLPFGALAPFEVQLRVEDLKRLAVSDGFDSPTLASQCAEMGAVCANPGPISARDIGRIAPKVQRAVLGMEAPAVSEPIKAEYGLFVIAVHGSEDRRPMVPPDDMEQIRARFAQLEEKSIVAEIREDLLVEAGFQVVAPLASTIDVETVE